MATSCARKVQFSRPGGTPGAEAPLSYACFQEQEKQIRKERKPGHGGGRLH
ncbi:hypothetical protein hamaS1_18980 [Moorella sp. Hama-1]|nr:hypothetical protein hamaS1_18980 [Moorella sp. Hama-1]